MIPYLEFQMKEESYLNHIFKEIKLMATKHYKLAMGYKNESNRSIFIFLIQYRFCLKKYFNKK